MLRTADIGNHYADKQHQHANYVKEGQLLCALWAEHFGQALDEFPEFFPTALLAIKRLFSASDGASVYASIEFIATCGVVDPGPFIAACNEALRKHTSAYRFVGNTLDVITSDQEIATTVQAEDDRRFAQLAIEEARKSVDEADGRSHPKVGAVVVREGKLLASAHRGEIPGCHAEYVALERKLADTPLAGATVYTTLEPCTERNHPKVPCARRLAERKVKRVVIGTLDPDPRITGRGQLLLRDANIVTDRFPSDLMTKIEELNRDFIRLHRSPPVPVGHTARHRN